jgi:hypothetical protein
MPLDVRRRDPLSKRVHPVPSRTPLDRAAHAAVPGARLVLRRSAGAPGIPARRDRVVHSTAFRRLDTRPKSWSISRATIPHAADAQPRGGEIARTLSRALALDEDLAEAGYLEHDLATARSAMPARRRSDAARGHSALRPQCPDLPCRDPGWSSAMRSSTGSTSHS